VIDSGETTPTGYQQILYHMIFEIKYDQRHESIFVAGVSYTFIEKEDIYLGVVQMDTVRIRFFLGELNGLSCCECDIGKYFLERLKRRFT
jgi:hypothetical protein